MPQRLAQGSAALKTIKESKALEDETAAKLKDEIEKFKKNLWEGEKAPDSPEAIAKEAEEAGDSEAAEEVREAAGG